MNYNEFHYIITYFHVISENTKSIEIEIWDKIIIPINLNNKYIIYLKKLKDITCYQTNAK